MCIRDSSYIYGGKTKSPLKNLEITNKLHPIFKSVKANKISFEGEFVAGIPVKWMGTKPIANLPDFYKAEILAYSKVKFKNNGREIGGIFSIQKNKKSGIVLCIGSEDWLLPKNFEKDNDLYKITLNAINFLVEKYRTTN